MKIQVSRVLTIQHATTVVHNNHSENALRAVDATSNSSVQNAGYVSALRLFQKVSGLPVTGKLDKVTRQAMNKPRCGVPDQQSKYTGPGPQVHGRSSSNENDTGNQTENTKASVSGQSTTPPPSPLGRHEKTMASNHLYRFRRARKTELVTGRVSGMAYAKKKLKWRLMHEGYSTQLTVEEQRVTLKLAFRLWSEVAPIDFEEDLRAPASDIDIKLGFGTGRHFGCSQVFDGAGQELAHAWQHGDIHFDDDEHFTTALMSQGISLLKVAVHEIGHVLGLPHIYHTESVMHPNYFPVGNTLELGTADRKAIQKLYGVCEGPFDTVFDWERRERNLQGQLVVQFNTFFFRKSWYWLYENKHNRTRYGDPTAISFGWHGLPSDGIDAVLQISSTSEEATYFFKGTQYWRYDSENGRAYTEDPQGYKYPRRISQGFPGVLGPIDAAFFDRRTQYIYFFHDQMVTAFNVNLSQKVNGFPKKIIDVFPPAVPGDHPVGNLDAVYYSLTHEAIFFLKGVYFWKVVGANDRLSNPNLLYNSLLSKRRVAEQWFDICDVHVSMLAKE
ncbi:matrix metalloproteinase-21-like [Protopterus annectens]|uniref:matrix metalloproteinase-21-like n=1 Tax=Protopterus annectens TaxID=7888 RepID=UPI001CFC2A68|nr:matrix metalloproteinase-21-like [Protopterus annectens]